MITLKQFTGQNITPTDDATLYELFSNSQAGLIYGCNVTSLGANQLQVSAGRGIILGRSFVVEQETVLAELAPSGTMKGRLSIKIDLGNAETPISFETQVGSVLPSPTQEQLNRGGSIYEMPLATYDADAVKITNLQNVAPPLIMPAPVAIESGTYVGDGAATKAIELGYKPYFVYVFMAGYPFNRFITSNSDVYIYAATALEDLAVKGLTITGDGFEVQQASTSPFDGFRPNLNQSGQTYAYLAVRK